MVFSDTLQYNSDKVNGSAIKQIQEEQDTDSIYLEKLLNKAVIIAGKNKSKEVFEEQYTDIMPDSSYQVEVNLRNDFFFSKKITHLVIRRKITGLIYIDIFFKKNNEFLKVISHEESEMTYVNDTIRDINGDGVKDFVVNWYGSNGCCLKAFSNVYLLRSDNTFSKSFEFINPTFDPKEKIIRGVCYGHPGDTEMYKYKWKGENVDTLEYVFYEKSNKGIKTGKVMVSTDYPNSKAAKVLKVLNSAPTEYKTIYGYNWFTGEGYD
ncbi:XAC2610-related protein [Flavobacterium suzhouense]|uniref:XAC2610-related protein n=1 Tax=Flavobacterium suzhouense TaxID=1529638 RepID=A0ABW5NRB0_9FLAO